MSSTSSVSFYTLLEDALLPSFPGASRAQNAHASVWVVSRTDHEGDFNAALERRQSFKVKLEVPSQHILHKRYKLAAGGLFVVGTDALHQ